MRYLLFFLALLIPIAGYSQNTGTINGDFLTNQGNNTIRNTECPSFTNTSVPGWTVTHGAPLFSAVPGGVVRLRGARAQDGNGNIVLESSGIAGDFSFLANHDYIIRIGFYSLRGDCGSNDDESILNVFATDAIPSNPNFPGSSQCGVYAPTSGFNSETISSIHTIGTVATNSFIPWQFIGEIELTYTPQQNMSYIYLFPDADTDPNSTVAEIDYIYIYEKCKDPLFIFKNDYYNNLVSNIYSPYKNIRIESGATYPMVFPETDKLMEFRASEYVVIKPNFKAEPTDEGYVLALADPFLCTEPSSPPSSKPGRGSAGSAREQQTLTDKAQSGNASIYPNPTSSSFTILMLQTGNYEVRVTNIVGTEVYHSGYKDAAKMTVQLDENLPPGNYILQIQGKGTRHIEKITLTK